MVEYDRHLISIESIPYSAWTTGITRTVVSAVNSQSMFIGAILTDVERNINNTFELETEDITPTNAEVLYDSGFLPNTHSNTANVFKFDIAVDAVLDQIDAEYQRASWVYSGGLYDITFDVDVITDKSYLVFELVDSNGVVKWTASATDTSVGTTISMESSSFEFRLRCVADITVTASDWHAYIENIVINRYKLSGTITDSNVYYTPYRVDFNQIKLSHDIGDTIDTKAQMNFSDNGTTWSGLIGSDGTNGTYLHTLDIINTNTYTGKYFKVVITLTGDGSTTPTFDYYMIHSMVTAYRTELGLADTIVVDSSPIYSVDEPLPIIAIDYESHSPYVDSTRSFNRGLIDLIENIFEVHTAYVLSGREFYRYLIAVECSFGESTWGRLISGYVYDQDGNIITDASRISFIANRYATDDTIVSVNPVTGLFQAFFTDTDYIESHLLMKQSTMTFNASLKTYGSSVPFNGSTVADTYNMTFFLPSTYKPKIVAHVDSLVTY